jgi:hypothetical protein
MYNQKMWLKAIQRNIKGLLLPERNAGLHQWLPLSYKKSLPLRVQLLCE